jgi:hypothetical protein
MNWTHCRYEGCRRKLPPQLQVYGFCDAICFSLHEEEKDVHMNVALEAFKREGEPNGGGR